MTDLEKIIEMIETHGNGTSDRNKELTVDDIYKYAKALQLLQPDVSGSALPEVWLDWNTLSPDQMAEHLRQKFMFSSSGDAKCIYHLIEFYDKHK